MGQGTHLREVIKAILLIPLRRKKDNSQSLLSAFAEYVLSLIICAALSNRTCFSMTKMPVQPDAEKRVRNFPKVYRDFFNSKSGVTSG